MYAAMQLNSLFVQFYWLHPALQGLVLAIVAVITCVLIKAESRRGKYFWIPILIIESLTWAAILIAVPLNFRPTSVLDFFWKLTEFTLSFSVLLVPYLLYEVRRALHEGAAKYRAVKEAALQTPEEYH